MMESNHMKVRKFRDAETAIYQDRQNRSLSARIGYMAKQSSQSPLQRQ